MGRRWATSQEPFVPKQLAPQHLLHSHLLTAMLPSLSSPPSQLATSDCSNLLYSAAPADCTTQGRRPAYLLELLRRAAACESSDGLATAAAANAQASSGARAGWAAVRAAVLESPHVAKLLTLWASSQVWLAESVSGFGLVASA